MVVVCATFLPPNTDNWSGHSVLGKIEHGGACIKLLCIYACSYASIISPASDQAEDYHRSTTSKLTSTSTSMSMSMSPFIVDGRLWDHTLPSAGYEIYGRKERKCTSEYSMALLTRYLQIPLRECGSIFRCGYPHVVHEQLCDCDWQYLIDQSRVVFSLLHIFFRKFA